MVYLTLDEFKWRIKNVRKLMKKESVDVFLVYGDEYRRENLRYVSNYWPIFDRGMLVIGLEGEPILLVAPEGESVAREMSIWKDIRLVPEVEPAYIPDKIDYGLANYTSLANVLFGLSGNKKPKRIKICGIDAMPVVTYEAIRAVVDSAKIGNGDDDIYRMRLIKSPAEVELLKRAWEICDIGYKAVLDAEIVSLTEIQAAAIGEKAARDAGAEHIVFSIFASGERTNTVVGRPTEKVIREGELIMAALAVQYQGYIATNGWPFVAGGNPTEEQKKFISHIVIAEDIGVRNLRPGVVAGEVVRKIKDYFDENGLEQYDVYPPIHGNGLAEAESPYPNVHSTYKFLSGMGINFDVSLFRVPGVGSIRIEEGFIFSKEGIITLSKLINSLRTGFLAKL